MAAKKVLYVNHVGEVSGAEESLLALFERLDRQAVAPALACPSGALARRAETLGVEALPLPIQSFRRTRNPMTLGSYAVAWVAGSNHLRRIIEQVRPAIVHCNSAKAQVYAGTVARKAGISCVWHARDLRPLPFPAWSLCRKTDRVIAVSDAVADYLAAAGLSRPTVTRIYNGIDPDAWRARVTAQDVRAALGLKPEARLLVMAAQFAPWKRHEDAIRAMPAILAGEPRARLIFAGDDRFGENPGLAEMLKKLAAEIGVSENVVFAGHREDVPDLMNAADLALVPSDAEPFGRSAIEAMALGRPVVGTRAGGLVEVVRDGETGLLVVPRFPESLAVACLRILENPSLARSLGQAGKRRVASLFHIEKTAARTQELYEQMLHQPLKWVHA